MMRVISSEWLRTKRTAVRWLTFCMPAAVSLCAVLYLAFRDGTTQEFAYEGFFTVWTVFILPVAAGVLSGSLVNEEELAGNFGALLTTSLSRGKLYLGKFLLLVFCIAICTFLATVVLCIGMCAAMPSKVAAGPFLAAAALTVMGALPLLALHLWVSFVWGMGASIGISLGGLLMAALLGLTSLGTGIWPLVPWTWPVKLGMLPGSFFLINAGTISPAQSLIQITRTASIGIVASGIGLLVFLLGGSLWFRRWEGRKSSA